MPNQTDRLTTILELQGLAQSVSGLHQLALAAQGAANPLSILSTRMQILPGLMARMNVGTAAASGGLIGMALAASLVVSGLREVIRLMEGAARVADPLSQSLARTLILFHNAGRATSPGALMGLARNRLATAGVAEESTLNLAGQLAERGFSPRRIGQLLPALQNIEAGTGGRTSALSAMEMFLRVLERPGTLGRHGGGSSRGLIGLASQLGVNIRLTGSFEQDLNNLTNAINQKFGGVAEALNQTASGVHLQTQQQLTAALGRLGQLIEAGMAPTLRLLNTQLAGFTHTVDVILHGGGQGTTDAFHRLGGIPGPLGFGFAALADAREREARLNRVDPNGHWQQQMLDTNRQIAANTQQVAGAVAQLIFGHASSFTRGAFAYRELNAAITFRT